MKLFDSMVKAKALLLAGVSMLAPWKPLAAATLLVWTNSPNPVPPFAGWLNAAHTIQDAVNAAEPGDTVLVTNGVYASGGKLLDVWTTVVVDRQITVQSVQGPIFTVIQGTNCRCAFVTNGAVLSGFTLTNGYCGTDGGGIWCAGSSAMATNCIMADNYGNYGGGDYGGTLNNCTLSGNDAGQGGGVYGATVIHCTITGNSANNGGGSYGGVLTNCMMAGNSAQGNGGGALGGTLNNCTLTNNSAGSGGAAYSGILNNCALTRNEAGYGGGVFGCLLNDCLLTSNTASSYGGGADNCTLNTCTLSGNTAPAGGGASYGTLTGCTLMHNTSGQGGGAFDVTLNNCVLTGNNAGQGGGAFSGALNNCALTGNLASFGGGAYIAVLNNCTIAGNSTDAGGEGGGVCGDWQTGAYSYLYNCIIYYNGPDNYNYLTCVLNYCCTTPVPSYFGANNISGDPLFVDPSGSNLQLLSDSPCIDAGDNAYAAGSTDIDGLPRIVDGTVDIGAYEYQGAPTKPVLQVGTSLPEATNAVPYTQQLSVTGGHPPYHWTIISGALPPGLAMAANGWISGMPTTNGTFNFTVQVSDAFSDGEVQPLSLAVTNLPSAQVIDNFGYGFFTLPGISGPYFLSEAGSGVFSGNEYIQIFFSTTSTLTIGGGELVWAETSSADFAYLEYSGSTNLDLSGYNTFRISVLSAPENAGQLSLGLVYGDPAASTYSAFASVELPASGTVSIPFSSFNPSPSSSPPIDWTQVDAVTLGFTGSSLAPGTYVLANFLAASTPVAPAYILSGTGIGVSSNCFGFNVVATLNIPFVIQSCTNLSKPMWTPMQTNSATNGAFYFSDPTWTNFPRRFYRVQAP